MALSTKLKDKVLERLLFYLLSVLLLLIIPIHCHAAYKGRIYVNGQWYTNHEDAYTASINAPNDKKYARVFIEGYKFEEVATFTEKIITYFQKEYGLTLEKDISVYVAKNTKEYKKKLLFCSVKKSMI